MTAIFDGLNPAQIEAVTAPLDRPCLVVAGAGSGKTTTLTRRIEWTIAQSISPDNVVAMTFTKKAAGELTARLAASTIDGADTVWCGTIHSFAYARVRAYRDALELAELEVLVHPKPHVKRLMGRPSEGYDEALRDFPELDLSVVLSAIGNWQNELVSPAEALDAADNYIEQWCARMYDAYTRWKRRTLRIDFGDMLGLAVDAYESDQVFLASDRKRYRHGLVDELQDTNTAQWRLIELLWKNQPLFGVGDPRQAIYEWRGARPEQLIGFERVWPDVVRVNLTLNYRSTPEIIAPAEKLISSTTESKASAPLVPTRPAGDEPEVVSVLDPFEEAEEAARRIGELVGHFGPGTHPCEYGDIAILYRTNAQSAPFEDEFAQRQIPYQVVGSKGFWARREIVQLLSYLRLTVEPNDAEAVQAAITAPSRYLGRAFVSAAIDLAKTLEVDLVEAVAHVRSYSGRALNAGQAAEASNFTTLIGSLTGMSPVDALEKVLRVSDFRRWLARAEGSRESADDDRVDAISQLLSAAGRFVSVPDLLAHAESQRSKSSTSSKPDPKRVQLLTIHRAKGLEWDHVMVAGFCEGLLPHERGQLSEERRLAYVAMTRARDTLTLLVPHVTMKGATAPSELLVDAGLVSRSDVMGVA